MDNQWQSFQQGFSDAVGRIPEKALLGTNFQLESWELLHPPQIQATLDRRPKVSVRLHSTQDQLKHLSLMIIISLFGHSQILLSFLNHSTYYIITGIHSTYFAAQHQAKVIALVPVFCPPFYFSMLSSCGHFKCSVIVLYSPLCSFIKMDLLSTIFPA